jgi:hypothetical protein
MKATRRKRVAKKDVEGVDENDSDDESRVCAREQKIIRSLKSMAKEKTLYMASFQLDDKSSIRSKLFFAEEQAVKNLNKNVGKWHTRLVDRLNKLDVSVLEWIKVFTFKNMSEASLKMMRDIMLDQCNDLCPKGHRDYNKVQIILAQHRTMTIEIRMATAL